MPEHPPHPVCSQCNYDLSGITPDENGYLICPECGNDDQSLHIEVENRSFILHHAAVWLLAVPITHASICWFLLLLAHENLIAPAVFSLLFHLLFVTARSIYILFYEHQLRDPKRLGSAYYRFTPSLGKIQLLISVCWLLSSGALAASLVPWILLAISLT
ncbi:MAG: hypothetical protein KC996_07260 [Phycisphaerales bacterium]|nr:hypothetical protein [Phycisphaerales bacterium]